MSGQLICQGLGPKRLASTYICLPFTCETGCRDRHKSHFRKAYMAVPVTEDQRHLERQELRNHVAAKAGSEQDQFKLDRLDWVIGHYGLDVSPEALKRANTHSEA